MSERVSYDRGVHLRGTALWFDAERARELCVLTGLVDKLPPAHARAVACGDLVALLDRLGYRGPVLPTSYERWVGVGGHKLKMVDVGARPTGAAALVMVGTEHVVVTGVMLAESKNWPTAEHLVAHVPALAHRGGTLQQATSALRTFVSQALKQGSRPVVLVESIDLGLHVIEDLRGAGLGPRALGMLGKLVDGEPEVQASVGLARSRIPAGARVAFLDTGLGEWQRARLRRAPPDVTLRVKWYADGLAVQRAVTAMGARKVTLLRAPMGARVQLERLLGRSVQVRWLSKPRQLELAAELLPVVDG